MINKIEALAKQVNDIHIAYDRAFNNGYKEGELRACFKMKGLVEGLKSSLSTKKYKKPDMNLLDLILSYLDSYSKQLKELSQ